MAKVKQTSEGVKQEDDFLFAIGTPEGEHIIKVGLEGNIEYIKAGMSMDEASKAFWDSFQGILPVTAEDIQAYDSDADLGAYVRARMNNKVQNK